MNNNSPSNSSICSYNTTPSNSSIHSYFNSPSNSSICSYNTSLSNGSIHSYFNSPSNSSIHTPINTPPDDFLCSPINSPFNTSILENSIKKKSSYEDFGDKISIESFEFNTPPSQYIPKENELFSTSYDSNSNIAMLCDDRISLFSEHEDDIITIKSNKSIQVKLNNITNNKVFDRKSYKEEINKKNTFLNNQKYQIEFNKLILNEYIIKTIDKIILRFI